MCVRMCDIEFVVFTDCESCTYEADFHKPGIYGSGRARVNAWDVVFRAPSRGGRGRRAAVAFALCFGWGGLFRDYYFSDFFFSERTRPAASMRPHCLIYLSTSTRYNLMPGILYSSSTRYRTPTTVRSARFLSKCPVLRYTRTVTVYVGLS